LKLKRIRAEKEKTKNKIAELQERLSILDEQETEIENAEILATVRKANLSNDEFDHFIKTFSKQGAKAEAMLTDDGKINTNDAAQNMVSKEDISFLDALNIPSMTDENALVYNGETENREDFNNYEN